MPNQANKKYKLLTLRFSLDLFLTFLSWFLILFVSNITDNSLRSYKRSLVMAAVATIVTLWVMSKRNLYGSGPALPRTEEISRVFISVLSGAAGVTIFAAFTDWWLGAWEIILGSFLLFGLRTLSKGILSGLSENDNDHQRVVIIGSGREAKDLAQLIMDHPESKFHLCGVIGNLAIAEKNGVADLWIGPTGRLVEIMSRHQIKTAIITTTGFRGERFKKIAKELFDSGFQLHLTTGISRMWEGRFDVRSLVHEPFISVGKKPASTWEKIAKRSIDIVGSLVALILASPILLLTALAIFIEDRSSVTYTSQRTGSNGKSFPMYKFRSMVSDADKLKSQIQTENERSGPLFKMSNDPRITRVGKLIRETSIDELPQLFNVLRGDMSLVGPRPALPEEVADFDEELRKRTDVKPGITGLWQVEARSNAAFNAYRRLDLHYVENWSIWLDLRILLATVEQVVVSLFLLPIRKLKKGSVEATDAISTSKPNVLPETDVDTLLDLRETKERERQPANNSN